MSKFVCVRIVQGNGMDLTQFQFDFDLTFAIFMMNADGTIYGRFGTRSSLEDATKDISLQGLRKALEGALALHAQYPLNRAQLADKRGAEAKYPVPEDYPSLNTYKPQLDYEGQVARSCIHCHQVRDAERKEYREARQAIPDKVLYPWPMPETIGLTMNRDERAQVMKVAAGSPADQAGIMVGDELLRLNDQPLLSIADIQWVLHNAGNPAQLTALVRRGNETTTHVLKLSDGRRRGDMSWRVTTWDLRRMGTGGLLLEELADEARHDYQLEANHLALFVKHVGQYGAHGAAKRAGFRKGDVIVAVEGRNLRMSETDLLAYVLQHTVPGDRLDVVVLRDGKRVPLELPAQ